MFLETANKNMFGVELGIPTAFETLGHILFTGDLDHPVRRTVMIYISSDAP
jgi:hypothetical protein